MKLTLQPNLTGKNGADYSSGHRIGGSSVKRFHNLSEYIIHKNGMLGVVYAGYFVTLSLIAAAIVYFNLK